MAPTRAIDDLMRERAERDPAFRDSLLREGIDTMQTNDLDTGNAILRDYTKATVGFERHAPKSMIACGSPPAMPVQNPLDA